MRNTLLTWAGKTEHQDIRWFWQELMEREMASGWDLLHSTGFRIFGFNILLKGRNRDWGCSLSASSFSSACLSWSYAWLEPGACNSIQVSHMRGRDPSTQLTPAISQGMYQQDTGIRVVYPGTPIWDADTQAVWNCIRHLLNIYWRVQIIVI